MEATLADVNERHTGGVSRSSTHPLSTEERRKIDAYWRACNYLAVGMIYLRENPLLRDPLKPEHIKNRLLGHWGSSTGLSFTMFT
jgi:xylulose-5-phosphate/fructose-6-phosphate phosphoketolase